MHDMMLYPSEFYHILQKFRRKIQYHFISILATTIMKAIQATSYFFTQISCAIFIYSELWGCLQRVIL